MITKEALADLLLQQEAELKEHVVAHHYHDSKALIKYVMNNYEVKYSPTGMVVLLHRLGFTYKKLKIIPGKADAEKQLEYLENELKPAIDKASDESPLYFLQMAFTQRIMFSLSVAGYLKGPTRKFKQFRNAVFGFFENIEKYKKELSTLLVDNFQIIGN